MRGPNYDYAAVLKFSADVMIFQTGIVTKLNNAQIVNFLSFNNKYNSGMGSIIIKQ